MFQFSEVLRPEKTVSLYRGPQHSLRFSTRVKVYDRLGIRWATSLLGFLSVAMVPIPWVLINGDP